MSKGLSITVLAVALAAVVPARTEDGVDGLEAAWASALASHDAERSARAFDRFGGEGREFLVARLRNGDLPERARTVQILGFLGSTERPVAHALVEALYDSDGGVRSEAAAALARLAPKYGFVQQALAVRYLYVHDEYWRVIFVARIRCADDPAQLPDIMFARNGFAAWRILELVATEHGLPDVVQGLLSELALHPYWRVRATALKVRHSLAGGKGASAAAVVDAAFGALREDPSAAVRRLAGEVLCERAAAGASIPFEQILPLLGDGDPRSRVVALALLVMQPDAASQLEGRLLHLLDDEDVKTRRLAMLALRHSPSPQVAAALRAALDDADAGIQDAAALALAATGAAPPAAWSRLLELVFEDSWRFMPLKILGPGEPPRLPEERDPCEEPKLEPLALEALDNDSEDALEALVPHLQSEDASRRFAAVALAARWATKIGPSLEPHLDDEDESVRVAAAALLVHAGHVDARTTMPLIKALGGDPLKDSVFTSRRALRAAGTRSVPFLLAAVRELLAEDPSARQLDVIGCFLGQLDYSARKAVQAAAVKDEQLAEWLESYM